MLFEMGRTLLSLAFVLGLLWCIARVGRGRQVGGRSGRAAGRSGRAVPGGGTRIEMLGRRSLGRHSAVFVIKVAGRTMVVGQTPQQITVLAQDEAPAPEVGDEALGPGVDHELMPGLASGSGAGTPTAWDAFVDRLREMTVRH